LLLGFSSVFPVFLSPPVHGHMLSFPLVCWFFELRTFLDTKWKEEKASHEQDFGPATSSGCDPETLVLPRQNPLFHLAE
jgi:hypothetical protein